MKKNLFLLICIIWFANFQAKTQTYNSAYERQFNDFCNYFSNNSKVLGWQVSYALEADIMMYETTGDLVHLERFVHGAKAVLSSRMDNPLGITGNGWIYQYPISYYISHKGWSAPDEWPSQLMDFKIIQPMAEFVHLIKDNPTLGNQTPASITFTGCNSTMSPRNDLLFGANSTVSAFNLTSMTYNQIADYLLARCLETIDEWEPHWDNTDGYKSDRDSPGVYIHTLQLNAEATIGSTLLYIMPYVPASLRSNFMYKIEFFVSKFKNSITTNAFYSSISSPAPATPGAHLWDYYTHHTGADDVEDISHAGLDMKFVYDYMKIRTQFSGLFYSTHFYASDYTGFASTFINNIAFAPLYFNLSIDGSDNTCVSWICHRHTDSHVEFQDKILKKSYMPTGFGRFLPLSETDDDILHRVQDHLMEQALYDVFYSNYTATKTTTYDTPGLMLLSFAYAIKYNKYFNPIASTRTPGRGSNWRGVTGGNIDGVGADEIISVRELNNEIILWQVGIHSGTGNKTIEGYDTGNMPGSSNRFDLSPYGSNWVGVASGNFTNDYPGDEFALVNNFNGQLHFFRFEQSIGQIVHFASYTNASTSSDWAGIASGDVDNDGIDEIGLVRNVDNQLFIWGLDPSHNITSFGSLHLPNGNDFVAIVGGDFDNNGNDEFIVLSNGQNPMLQAVDFDPISASLNVSNANTTPGIKSNWKAMAAGNFSGSGHDELVAYRDFDGAFYQFTRDGNGDIISTRLAGGEHFPIDERNHVLGSIHIDESAECPDYLLINRNFDGHMFMYGLYDEKYEGCYYPEKGESNVGQVSERLARNTTSKHSENEETKLVIFPNPVNEILVFKGIQADILDIIITDSQGKIIEVPIELNKINTSGLASGIYFLVIRTLDQQYQEMFIKK